MSANLGFNGLLLTKNKDWVGVNLFGDQKDLVAFWDN
jgi:hypothetical protein